MRKRYELKKYIGLFLTVLLIGTLLTGCGNSLAGQTVVGGDGSDAEEVKKTETAEKNTLYIVNSLDSQTETLTVSTVKSGDVYQYPYSLSTKFLNKYGDTTSWMNFTPGQVVTLGDTMDSKALSYVKMSKEVWSYDDITKFSIDAEEGIFTLGKTNYRVSKNVPVFSDADAADISDITDTDILRVVGKGKKVLSIAVTTGHGYIEFVNTALFDNSLAEIGARIYAIVSEGEKIEVPQGSYTLTVANNGYGGSQDITVERNQTTVVDLEQLKGSGPKYCDLSFQVAVSDALLYLDGTEISAGQTVQVGYGKHALKVVATGYQTWDKTLYVNSPKAVITLDLSDEDDTDSSTDTSSSGSSSSGTSSSGSSSSGTSSSGTSSSGTSSSGTSSSSSSTASTDSQADYLTTLSKTLSSLLGNSSSD